MIPILTITLNPALDISTRVEAVVAGPKLRCAEPTVDPGGGGINVARAIRALGGDAQALVALGGATGQRMADELSRDGIAFHAIPSPGETRQSLAVTEESTGKQFRFVLPGAAWSATDVRNALQKLAGVLPPDAIVVVSGSQPPGVPLDFPAHVRGAIAPKAMLVIDTSGAALKQLLASPVPGLDTLRMDSEEAEDLAGHPLPRREDTAAFAADLVARGVAKTVIVARGADGSVLSNAEQRWFCKAADVPVKSKVGAGDSFVAGYVLALARGEAAPQALVQGVAAASAAVMTEATELCRREDAERLRALCPVSAL